MPAPGDGRVAADGRKTTMSVPGEDSAVLRSPAIVRHGDWLRLFVGIVAIGLGGAAFAWPDATVHVIGFLFGLNLVLTGVIRAGLLLFAPGYPVLHRVLGITFGVFTAIAGIICLRNIAGSVVLLLVVVAIGWLLDGLAEIFLADGGAKQSGAGVRIATGLISILGAIALLVWPKIGLGIFIGIGATVLVFVGIGQVIIAIAGMRAARRPRPVLSPGAARPETTSAG
jgi:uncharacterized membrane protein HdeD (DUF308 family)